MGRLRSMAGKGLAALNGLLDRLSFRARLLIAALLLLVLGLEGAVLSGLMTDLRLAGIDRELAGSSSVWIRGALEPWRLEEISPWQIASVSWPVPAMERVRGDSGYLVVREPVELVFERDEESLPLYTEAVPLLEDHEGPGLVGFQAVSEGEALTLAGFPVRWYGSGWERRADAAIERPLPSSEPGGQFSYVPALSGLGHKTPVLRYVPLVLHYAAMYKVPARLLLALMQVESGGRETLVSSRNAIGLMQVLPDGAGEEVKRHLGLADQDREDGRDILRASLFAPGENIHYGACYVHLLETRYFGRVEDRDARTLCVIASYNIGPGRFLRLFSEDKDEALRLINRFSARGLYEEIKENVDEAGGFDYVDKVVTLLRQYRSMGY